MTHLRLGFLAVFVLIHSPNGNSVRSYEGQSKQAIQLLLANEGVTSDFITEKEYKDYLDANKQVFTNEPEKDQARVDFNSKSKTDTQRIEALIKYFGLDK